MAFDYTKPRTTADRLIGKFGATMALRRPGVATGPGYNPTLGAPTFHTIVAVDLNEKRLDAKGTMVIATTRTLLVRTKEGVVPAKGDRVKVDGAAAFLSSGSKSDTTFGPGIEVVEVRPLAPGGANVLFEVDLAR